MRIKIQKQISDTHLEIYEFELLSTLISYSSILISRRNDINDIWGHFWKKHYFEEEYKKRGDLLKKHGYEDMMDALNDQSVLNDLYEIEKQYNPVANKTKDGKPYLSGCSFGGSLLRDEHKIKMTKQELRKKIFEEVEKSINQGLDRIERYLN
jgi:hypothetical protein